MRDLFFEYYKPSDEEFSELWRDCIFAFDTNVLLSFYRYSEETRTILVEILKKLNDRIWLPYQVAHEYQKDRLDVISKQEKAYEGIRSLVKTCLNQFKSEYSRHPFIDTKAVENTLTNAEKSIDEILEKAKKNTETSKPQMIFEMN
ncbi:MAG: PIN domain-containing protein [Blastocatellia bacterium]|nr:PIN domain-containing protein [Blastocatellia bacterium]